MHYFDIERRQTKPHERQNKTIFIYVTQNVPVVITWDGLVTRHFKRYMKQLQVKPRLQAYIQTVVLKRTCESILADCRGRRDWLEEEASDLMAQLEPCSSGTESNELL